MENSQSGNLVLKVFLVILLVVGLFSAALLVGQSQIFKKQASETPVRISLTPTSVVAPNTVKVVVDPNGQNVIFVKAVILFDKSKLKLAADPTIKTTVYKNQVKVSTVGEANSLGKVLLVVAADPSGGAITTVSEIASLPFAAIGTSGSSVQFSTSEMQIINSNSNILQISAEGATFSVPSPESNPLSPSPSPSPISENSSDESTSDEKNFQCDKPGDVGCFDCNNDWEVTILDFSCFSRVYDATISSDSCTQPGQDSCSNCNQDNVVNILDYSCFSRSYGKKE